ncbi:major facilitator superfamily domain-containing protein [Chaetomium sp. MPI-CAGE-AT-0009]|nr:major facilitator superfamily domain-containing protein [Chaetomium sp. MPI-CAGE-AT-0009]
MADDKKIAEFSESQLSRSDDEGQEITWTEAEEKALVRRIDLLVMPLLILGFFALQLDRGNIGNALTDYFLRDVGITQFQFNIGQQLLSAGIVLLEVHILQRGFYSAGFIPAGLFTITRWYKRDETSKRFSAYFIGNMLAGACSGLIAYGILHMRGIAGLAGWQWLFLLEGLFTILIGVLFLTLFPRSSGNPVSLLGFRYFSEREAQILQQRVLRDDPTKFQPRRSVSWAEAKATFTNWRLLPHILLTLTCLAPATTMGAYAPSLVVSFGFDRLKSNAMVSIGSWCLIITNILWGTIADKTGRRGPLVFLGILILWGLTLGNRLLVESTNGNLRFGVLAAGIAFQGTFHPVHGSWLALNAKTAGERSITMALFIMSANLSGIIGGQLFQARDAPLYKTGWTVILALVSVGVVMAIAVNVQYWVLNRVQKRVGDKRYHY